MEWLIADQDIIFCSKLMQSLQQDGYLQVAEVCHDGLTAINKVAQGGVEGIILDLLLPCADGLTVLEEITQAEPINIVVITAFYHPQLIAQAQRLGAQLCLKKPIDKQQVYHHMMANKEAFQTRLAQRAQLRAGLWLDYFGMSRKLSGYRMLCYAVGFCAQYPTLSAAPQRSVYPAVAKAFECSLQSVERNIRTAIETLWLKGHADRLYTYLGQEITAERGKPTNRQMIATLSQLVKCFPPIKRTFSIPQEELQAHQPLDYVL